MLQGLPKKDEAAAGVRPRAGPHLLQLHLPPLDLSRPMHCMSVCGFAKVDDWSMQQQQGCGKLFLLSRPVPVLMSSCPMTFLVSQFASLWPMILRNGRSRPASQTPKEQPLPVMCEGLTSLTSLAPQNLITLPMLTSTVQR